jgi:hypothetical protein
VTDFRYLPGDDLPLDVTWTSAGIPIDLTGYTASFRVDLLTEILELTIGDGITVTPAEGLINVHIDNTETAEWSGDYGYRLQMTSPGGIKTSLIWGRLVKQHAID